MIGFNHLGRHGRLGNQMFQYAGLRGIAAKHGYEFCIPPSDFQDQWMDHQLFEAFKLPGLTNIAVCPGPYVQEEHFHFDQNLFDRMPDGHNVYGYLQSEKWFKHIESEIREDFEFKNNIKEPCQEMIGSVDRPIALRVLKIIMIVHSRTLIVTGLSLFSLTILLGVTNSLKTIVS